MEEQSFRLLLSKLEGLEQGQSRMYLQFNERMDRQDELFRQHKEDDKKLSDKIDAVEKEVNIAKGIVYVLGGGGAFTAWMSGWFK